MTGKAAYTWAFKARFRARAFGWKSQPAITRIKEAVAEIRKIARTDGALGGEGAVIFIEKLVPAIEQVDGSSGAIGTAVNNAIDALARAVGDAKVEDATREAWLERLLVALQDDGYGYLDSLGDTWGMMCASPECASRQADALIGTVRRVFAAKDFAHFKGTDACLSSLLAAGRCDELLELLEGRQLYWHERVYGVRALAAMGRVDEAVAYAEKTRDAPIGAVALACEDALISAGRKDQAYRRFAIEANQGGTRIATCRAIVRKYPERDPRQILDDLIASTPGDEGKWFAAARALGFLELARELARTSPCDPRTLNRAARDLQASHPAIAMDVALASLEWMARGQGYDLTSGDVTAACGSALAAAAALGQRESCVEVLSKLADRVAAEGFVGRWVKVAIRGG